MVKKIPNRKVKLGDFEFGISYRGVAKNRIMVPDEKNKDLIWTFRKENSKWYCIACERKSKSKRILGVLNKDENMFEVPPQHTCAPRSRQAWNDEQEEYRNVATFPVRNNVTLIQGTSDGMGSFRSSRSSFTNNATGESSRSSLLSSSNNSEFREAVLPEYGHDESCQPKRRLCVRETDNSSNVRVYSLSENGEEGQCLGCQNGKVKKDGDKFFVSIKHDCQPFPSIEYYKQQDEIERIFKKKPEKSKNSKQPQKQTSSAENTVPPIENDTDLRFGFFYSKNTMMT